MNDLWYPLPLYLFLVFVTARILVIVLSTVSVIEFIVIIVYVCNNVFLGNESFILSCEATELPIKVIQQLEESLPVELKPGLMFFQMGNHKIREASQSQPRDKFLRKLKTAGNPESTTGASTKCKHSKLELLCLPVYFIFQD